MARVPVLKSPDELSGEARRIAERVGEPVPPADGAAPTA